MCLSGPVRCQIVAGSRPIWAARARIWMPVQPQTISQEMAGHQGTAHFMAETALARAPDCRPDAAGARLPHNKDARHIIPPHSFCRCSRFSVAGARRKAGLSRTASLLPHSLAFCAILKPPRSRLWPHRSMRRGYWIIQMPPISYSGAAGAGLYPGIPRIPDTGRAHHSKNPTSSPLFPICIMLMSASVSMSFILTCLPDTV